LKEKFLNKILAYAKASGNRDCFVAIAPRNDANIFLAEKLACAKAFKAGRFL